MKLYQPRVETRLRRVARAAVRASPQLAAEARRYRKQQRRQYTVDDWLLRVVGSGCLPVLLAVAPPSVRTGSALAFEYGAALFTLWGMATVLSGAQRLSALLAGDQERLPLLFLPIADADVYRRQGAKFFRRSTWAYVEATVAYAWLTWELSPERAPSWVWVPFLALAHWLLTLALSVALVERRRLLARLGVALLGIWGLFLVLLFDRRFIGLWLAERLAEGSDWIILVVPTGWPTFILEGLARQQWSWPLVLAPLGLLLWSGKRSWTQLQADFVLQNLDSVSWDRADEDLPAGVGPQSAATPSGQTALIDQIHSREFLKAWPVWSPQDPLERLAARWLTAREQLLAEITIDGNLPWSRRWWKALWILLLGSLCAWSLQAWGFQFFGWVDALVLLVVAGTTLPTHVSAGPQIIGLLPIRLGELLRLRTKLWLIRSTCALPLFGLAGLLLAWRLHLPVASGLAVGLKGALLLHGLFPYAGLLGSGESRRQLGLRSLGFLVLLLLCLAASVSCALLALVPEFLGQDTWLGWLCLPLAALPAWGFAAFYLWQFNRGRVDLAAK
ncbi:MAG TPA: hypothetical protein VNU68_00250 [Verrucomicrobiae bacterium]|nr:hypothetical protein [Verrucomicrobiae bacterium]